LSQQVSEIIVRQDFAVSAERVFDALADQDAMGRWMHAKISVRSRGEDGLVGTVRRIQLGPASFDEQIVDAERPVRVAYQISSPVPLLVKHRGELQVEALGPRQARVTWRVVLQLAPDAVGVLVRPLLARVLRKALARLARQLAG
jgi:uncharacterized protein YndB with AHSA1/START domain